MENFSLPVIPGLILVGTYLACYNLEKSDEIVVGSKHAFHNKNKNHMNDMAATNNLKAASKERIDFYTQYLASIVFSGAKFQRSPVSLTLEYNSAYKFLEDFRFIKRIWSSPVDEMCGPRFLYNTDQNRAFKLARYLGIEQLGEFLHTVVKSNDAEKKGNKDKKTKQEIGNHEVPDAEDDS